MKQFTKLWTASLLLATGWISGHAETVSNYTVDFNDRIDTSLHNFQVAPNWGHIVDFWAEDWGDDWYMTYTYKTNGGVDNSGYLWVGNQQVGSRNAGYEMLKDCLVTPVVGGQVTIMAKPDSSSGYVQIYTVNADGTAGTMLKEEKGNGEVLNTSSFQPVTITLDAPQKLAIRASQIGLDNFSADTAEVTAEASMKISSAVPSDVYGTLYWNQQADGSVLVKYDVTVKNDGQLPLMVGDEGYSVSIVYTSADTELVRVNVPQDLQPGEESDPFEVSYNIPKGDISKIWSSTWSSEPMNLRENIKNTKVTRAPSKYLEYEPKFAFRAAGTSTTSSLSTAYPIPYGIGSEGRTIDFEIYNDGNAPQTIQSITVDGGFTAEYPEGEFAVEPKQTASVKITKPATPGRYKGNVTVVYLDKQGTERTYALPLFGYTVAEGTWYCDFDTADTNNPAWPDGSIAENAFTSQERQWYSFLSWNDYKVKTSTSASYKDADNKFITPRLHAEAGDKFYFETCKSETSATEDHKVKVYISSDRKNWGEPLLTVNATDFATRDLRGYEVAIPESGDYYIGLATFGMMLDNMMGLTRVEVPYDYHVQSFTVPEKVKSGEEFTCEMKVLRSASAGKDDYTVKLYVNNEEVATTGSVDLPFNAKGYQNFSIKRTESPEVTTGYEVRMAMEFTDGTVVSTETKTVQVTFESEFGFYPKDNHGSKFNHDSLSIPIAFGKTNRSGIAKNFEFYNWGSAPLQVTSVTVPSGFSTTLTEATVEPMTATYLDILFSPADPGEYTGNLEIGYIDGMGEPAVYTLEISGTMLDPTKWYANFDNGTATGEWPAGTLHQSNCGLENSGNLSMPNFQLYASSGSSYGNRMFISPRVSSVGETLQFDARYYNSTWKEGGVQVYCAATREGLLNEEGKRTELGDFYGPGKNGGEGAQLSDTMQTFTVEVPEGEWYIGLAPYSRCRVDEIYGLTLAPIEGLDLIVEGWDIPATAMQNCDATATAKIYNVGMEPVAADDYEVLVYVNGEATVAATTVELPVVNELSNPARIDVPFRSTKVGTFPVYMALEAGDYRVESTTKDVAFAAEVAMSDKVVGTAESTVTNAPVNFYDKNSESVMLFTAEALGLKDGDRINRIAFKGYSNKEITTKLRMYYELTDDQTLSKPSNGLYDLSSMTMLRDDTEAVTWGVQGSSSEMVELFVMELAEPIVYQGGKSLKLFMSHLGASAYISSSFYNYQSNSTTSYSYYHSNDNSSTLTTNSWNTCKLPVLYLGLAAESGQMTGMVTDRDGNAIEGALVTLSAADGAKVGYETVSGADGSYAVNVVQALRHYDAVVAAEGLAEFEDDITFEGSVEKDFMLRPVFRVHGAATHTGGDAEGVVYLDQPYNQGYNAVTLPVALDADEIAAIFGDATVLEFTGETREGNHAVAQFAEVSETEAGKPYLIYLHGEQPELQMFRSKEVAESLTEVPGETLTWTPTAAQTDLTPDMFLIQEHDFVPASHIVMPAALNSQIPSLPAYSAYIKATGDVQSVALSTNADLPDAVEAIVEEADGEVIYNLNGIRVKNAEKGLYIVNGKAVIVR